MDVESNERTLLLLELAAAAALACLPVFPALGLLFVRPILVRCV